MALYRDPACSPPCSFGPFPWSPWQRTPGTKLSTANALCFSPLDRPGITLLNFEISSRYRAYNGSEGTRRLLCQRNAATPFPSGPTPFSFSLSEQTVTYFPRMGDALKTAMNYIAARAGRGKKRRGLPANGDENKRRRENGRERTGLGIATIQNQGGFVVCVIVNTHQWIYWVILRVKDEVLFSKETDQTRVFLIKRNQTL